MKAINGKHYPLWEYFVDKKEEWIGGVLECYGDSMDRQMGIEKTIAKIINITLEPNGKDDAFFEIRTDKGGFGFSTEVGGIGGDQEAPWLTFAGYGGHKFRIKKKEVN